MERTEPLAGHSSLPSIVFYSLTNSFGFNNLCNTYRYFVRRKSVFGSSPCGADVHSSWQPVLWRPDEEVQIQVCFQAVERQNLDIGHLVNQPQVILDQSWPSALVGRAQAARKPGKTTRARSFEYVFSILALVVL